MSEEVRITTVIEWQNGMVMVFDQHGQQMPEYQGRAAEVREKILAAAPNVEWKHRTWRR